MSPKRAEPAGDTGRTALLNVLEDLKAENEARRKSENGLRDAETRYRLLFEYSPDGIVILDPATARPLEFNETACRQLGYSREEFARLAISDYEASETAEETFARIARVLREGRNDFETRHRTRSGEIRDILVTAQVTEILGKSVYHCVWRDITESKRAEARLRDSEENMRYIVKHDPNAVAIYDRDLHYIAVSDRYLQDYGVKEEDIIGKHHYEVFPEMPQRWKDVHQRCLAGAIERDDDDSFERPDGSVTYNRWECRPWRRADGEIGGIITYTEVTTERKKAEKALRDSEEKFKAVFESANVGKSITLPSGEITVNRAFADMLGYEWGELKDKMWQDLTPADEIASIQDRLDRLLAGEADATRFAKRYIRKDGGIVWGDVSAKVRRDGEGRPIDFITTVVDITERKKAEDALQGANETLRALIRSSPLAIIALDPDGNVTLWNEASERMFGWSESEALGRFLPLVPEDKREEHAALRASALRGAGFANIEARRRRKDGSPIDIVISTAPLRDAQGRIIGIISVSADITERNRAMENIRKLSAAVEQSTEGIAIADLEGRLTFANEAWCRMHGYEGPREVLGRSLNVFHSPEQIANDVKPFNEKALELGAFSGEVGHITRDGRSFPTLMTTTLLKDDQGKPYALVALAKDITERKKAEEILRESEVRLNKLGAWVPGMIYQFKRKPDGAYCVPFSTEAIRDIFGCSPQEVREDFSPIGRVILPEDLDRVVLSIEDSAERLSVWSCEYRVQRPGHPVRWMLGTATPERSDDGSITWYGYNMDITERKEMDEAVRSSLREKETLLREIHHRVKNNMQVISSLFNLQAGHIADEGARRMLKEGQLRIRSMALIHEKLYRARDLSKIEFASYIQSLAAHLFQFFQVGRGQIRLESDLEDIRLDVNTAVPSGLLVNELISNALKHAFPGGREGTVWIKLRRQKDGSLRLTVADDGVGLPEGFDVRRAKSFGLQIVDLLVGQLEATLEIGRKKGTTFTITFRELEYKPRT